MNDSIRIYARNTTVSPLTTKEADDFFLENHRQSYVKKKFGRIDNLGLFYNDTLVAAVQFGAPRTTAKTKRYSKELYRMAFLAESRIVGGASKLIKHFIKIYKPADIFTYQDTSGETTDVYAQAGMTLVSQTKNKKYLVAPGSTMNTGSRKEVLGMSYATRYGPDRILGTKLGEVLRSDGKRKTNLKLFIEDLGWHIEETSGDRVYEWVDPNRTYYTYKISATDSKKFYYGVRHLKIANATRSQCEEDDYWGSGSPQMKEWMKEHSDSLKREIMGIYSMRNEAYYAEADLITESWKADKGNSLNFHLGSIFWDGGNSTVYDFQLATCEIHGETKHRGDKCAKCTRNSGISIKECEIHGETKHSGDDCFKCYNKRTVTVEECLVHGMASHQGGKCSRCSAGRFCRVAICDTHGKTSFKGNSCEKCTSAKRVYTSVCIIHGEGKFQGDKCYKCLQKDYENGTCEIHGETKLTNGGTCTKCRSKTGFYIDTCEKHGETKFRTKTGCNKCLGESRISMKECETHGVTKHNLNSCYMCREESRQRTIEQKKVDSDLRTAA